MLRRYLSSFDNLISLGAGLDAVEALDITVAGRAIVSITSPGGLSCVGGLGGLGGGTLIPLKFSLDLDLLLMSALLLPLLLWILPENPADPFSFKIMHMVFYTQNITC